MNQEYDVDAARIDIEKKVKAGFGQGNGIDYKPWIDIKQLSRAGRYQRPPGLSTGREHEFPNDDEYYYFRLLDLYPPVSDIREYFALTEIDETVEIANRFGLKHPTNADTNVPIPPVITYFVTLKTDTIPNFEAHLFRGKQTLEHSNTIDEIEIIYQYLKKRDIRLYIATKDQITKAVRWNIELLVKNYDLHGQNLREAEIKHITLTLEQGVQDRSRALRHVCTDCDKQLGLAMGTSLSIVYHLIARRHWKVDLTKQIDTNKPLEIEAYN